MSHFNGPEYDAEIDHSRLMKQHERVRNLMLDGHWRTLAEIAVETDDPVASISAQLRHLRKARFGGFRVERRARADRSIGLFEYRVLPPSEVDARDDGPAFHPNAMDLARAWVQVMRQRRERRTG